MSVLILLRTAGVAQDNILSESNLGSEFIFSVPPCYEDYPDPFNFIMIYVASSDSANITVAIGSEYFEKKAVKPNDVAAFQLTPAIAQCYSFSPKTDKPKPEKIFKNKAIVVKSDKPVAVYCVVRYNMSSDGFLVYPTSSIGSEYVVASYPDKGLMYGQYSPSVTTISAAFDDTKIKFIMGGLNEHSRTASGLKPGDTAIVTLNKNDVYVVMSDGDLAYFPDLTGSRIFSDKPIAVVSGNVCANVPVDNRWCDYIAEMDIPSSTWGKNYHVPITEVRQKNQIIRIFAKDKDTKIYRDSDSLTFLTNKSGLLNSGFFETRINEKQDLPAVIRSEKPIAVTFYNPGAEEDGSSVNNDPFEMAIVPVEQYKRDIIFCTPNAKGGKGFRDNYINIIYSTDSTGFLPDDYEIYAFLDSGIVSKNKLNELKYILDKPFKYDVFGKSYGMRIFKLPKDGVYRIRANSNFACYSYGFNDYDSYGYPTSISLADLNIPDFGKPRPTFTQECRGSFTGECTDYPEIDSLRSNLSYVYMNSRQSNNYDFKILNEDKFIPGKTRTVNWTLTVKDTTKDAFATLVFIDRSGNDTTIKFDYKPALTEISNNFIYWGNVKKGDTIIKNLYIKNKSRYPIYIKNIKILNANSPFHLINNFTTGLTCSADSNELINLYFTNNSSGYYCDTLLINGISITGKSECIEYKVVLKASIGEPIIIADSLDFGSRDIDLQAQTMSAYIYNRGEVTLKISDYHIINNNNVFKILNLPDSINKYPLIINPGGFYEYFVEFKPDSLKDYYLKIDFISDALDLRSSSYIHGKGVKAILKINNLSFNRTKVNRKQFPGKASERILTIINSGNQDVYINSVSIDNVEQAKSFYLNNKPIDSLAGLQIPSYSKIDLPVEFSPKHTGNYNLNISLNFSSDLVLNSNLLGIGIGPGIISNNLTFPERIIGDIPIGPVEDSLLYIRSNSKDIFSDTLTVYEIKPGAGIGNNNNFGFNGYSLNLNQIYNSKNQIINLPYKISNDDYLYLKPIFKPGLRGLNIDSVLIISDALKYDSLNNISIIESVDTAKSIFTGKGLLQKIDFDFKSKPICFNTIDTIKAVLRNNGDTKIKIENIKIDPDNNVLNVISNNAFEINPQDTILIEFKYSPNKPQTSEFKIITENNSINNPKKEDLITLKSIDYPIKTNSYLNKNFASYGEEFLYSLNIDLADKPILSNNKTLRVKLEYDCSFISADTSTLKLNELLSPVLISKIVPKIYKIGLMEVLEFTIKTDKNILLDSIFSNFELFNIKFNVYKPNVANDSIANSIKDRNVKIYHELIPEDLCLNTQNKAFTSININKTCVEDLGMVKFSENSFELFNVTPNPVISDKAIINFSLPFEEFATIKIYDLNMNQVVSVLEKQLKSGKYQTEFLTSGLAQGVYYYELKAGRLYKINRFTLIK